ncbi:MAG TPA: hydantoinase/oxoprolinase family protein [Candidatus Saccharimonadales bacterium]|nr:hydantoinase/oxoprolinase family protein [Candidatus Saccharimonadales bacterium]
MTARYRIGVDIGGTFTDVTMIDEVSGEIWIDKVLTTPRDPSVGFSEGVNRIMRRASVAPEAVRYLVHATTVATNAIIEGKAAPTAFITTEGFRDMLEIARQIRPSLYDLQFEKPRPLVPRQFCFGVPERLDARGNVLVSLDENALRAVAETLRSAEIASIAVCFLHSYLNPSHEQRAGEILRDAYPEASVSLSSAIAPEFREYFRASTTVINAAIQPVVAHYLETIERQLRAAGLSAELLVMQSSGGVFSFSAARERPVFMVESGPAAGVIAASYLGTSLGYADIISFDMGGTTAKAGLIQNGTPRVTKDYEVGSAAKAGVGGQRGSGYPIRTPVIDLVEIGAGGGSIAWVDSGGSLRVGPASAGADPGPACYGRGGEEPTITDANLVLGRLNPDFFLGGELKLEVDRAHRAIEEHCARPLGLDVVTAAHGIVEIANAAMVNALRLVSVQRGYDPRDFVLVAFGGAGPVHANRLAAAIEIPTTLIPLSPGITSALGLLVTNLKHEYATTLIQRVDRLDLTLIENTYHLLEAEGRAALARDGVGDADIAFVRQVDMRYVGQGYELTVRLPDRPLGAAEIADVLDTFHREHDRAYGYSAPKEPAEFVNLRLSAIGSIATPRLRELSGDSREVSAAQKGTRPVYFAESNGYVDCPIYDRYRLSADCQVAGPAVVEEFDSTTVIHPGYQASVDRFGNLRLRRSASNEGG